SLAREILQRPHGELTPAHITEALNTVRTAHAAGVRTVTAAAAFRLYTLGALNAPHSALTDGDGTFQGRRLSGDGPALRLDELAVRTADGVTHRPPPWPGRMSAVDVERTEDGRYRVWTSAGIAEADLATIAHLIARDPRLPRNPVAAIVLTRPDPGQHLSAALANVVNGRVWSTDAPLALTPSPTSPNRMVLTQPENGQWIPTDPGTLPGGRPGSVTLADGAVFADANLLTSAMLSDDGRRQTGISYTGADPISREELAHFQDAVTDHLERTRKITGPAPAFTVVGDSTETGPVVRTTEDGDGRPLSERETVGLLGRAQALRNFRTHSGILLMWPGLSSGPLTDPLTDITDAQRLANESGTSVFVPAPPEGTGHPPRIKEFRPEPAGARITALAQLTALGPVPQAGERVVRWVRALRALYGFDIDTSAARTKEFEQRLHGLAAFERRYLSTSPSAPPFSWNALAHQAREALKWLPPGSSMVDGATFVLDSLATREDAGDLRTMNAMRTAGPTSAPLPAPA
uniref:hypothetical protein n=1 Tax=Streptomyces otsuchiensis TaxID=2681388 RepID=UPI00130021C4